MKQKFLMLLAAVLLGCANAFAQSNYIDPQKGDVNGDGVVYVADINAILKIMRDEGVTATVYKYYAGVTDKVSFTESDLNQTTTTKPTTLSFGAAPSGTNNYQTFVYPSSWGKPTSMMAGGLDGKDGWFWGEQAGMESLPSGYTAAVHQGGAVTYIVTWPETFYFSFGITPITENNYTTANNVQQVTEYPSEFMYNIPTRSYVYVLVANDKTVEFIEPTLNAPIDASIQTDIIISGYIVYKSDIKLAGNVKIKISDAETLPDVMMGDANGDGIVNVSDVTAMINHILGKTPTPFNVSAADVNGDNIINVTDVTGAINIILNKK